MELRRLARLTRTGGALGGGEGGVIRRAGVASAATAKAHHHRGASSRGVEATHAICQVHRHAHTCSHMLTRVYCCHASSSHTASPHGRPSRQRNRYSIFTRVPTPSSPTAPPNRHTPHSAWVHAPTPGPSPHCSGAGCASADLRRPPPRRSQGRGGGGSALPSRYGGLLPRRARHP
jgi:hypothetical protein